MTVFDVPPPGLGIPSEDWQRTPESVRRVVFRLSFNGDNFHDQKASIMSEHEYQAIIDKGFGLLAGSDTVQDWMDELKQERQRDDERYNDWFQS
jgi:hypothetical protein